MFLKSELWFNFNCEIETKSASISDHRPVITGRKFTSENVWQKRSYDFQIIVIWSHMTVIWHHKSDFSKKIKKNWQSVIWSSYVCQNKGFVIEQVRRNSFMIYFMKLFLNHNIVEPYYCPFLNTKQFSLGYCKVWKEMNVYLFLFFGFYFVAAEIIRKEFYIGIPNR